VKHDFPSSFGREIKVLALKILALTRDSGYMSHTILLSILLGPFVAGHFF